MFKRVEFYCTGCGVRVKADAEAPKLCAECLAKLYMKWSIYGE